MEYWLGITGKFVVCFVFLCAGTDISATIQPIVVKFCVVRGACSGFVFSPFGSDITRGIEIQGQKRNICGL